MKILKIALKNLNSLKLDIVIDFTAKPLRSTGLFAIVGDTGAGKTTILDALTLGMYGRVHRNKNDSEVLSYGTVDGYAEVEFMVKEIVYRGKWLVHRSRGKLDGKLNVKRELARWNTKKEEFEIIAEKIREINGTVEEITGLDYERFCKSVLLSQGDFAAFLKAADKDRSNLLERITGTEVYSQISIAAYERHKLEEQRLNDIKRELDALQILDKETVKELKKDLKELKKEGKEELKKAEETQKQIQWRNRLTELESQQTKFKLAVANSEQKKEAAKTEFDKLERHQQTLVFQSDLTKLEGLEITQVNLKEEGEEGAKNIQNYQENQNGLKEKETLIIAALSVIKKEKETKEKVFQKVTALDIKLEEKRIPCQQTEEEKEKVDQEVANNQRGIKEFESKEEKARKLVEDINIWLGKYDFYENLAGILPALRNSLTDWTSQQGEKKVLEKELSSNKVDLEKIQGFLNNFEENLEEHNQVLKESEKVFLSHFSKVELEDRGKVLEEFNLKLESLDSQFRSLEMLIQLNDDYQELIQELTLYNEEISDLESKREQIESRLLTAIELEDGLKNNYEYKLQMFEREKLFANYDRERANLTEGEKCPLCFSTNHPFRVLDNYKPYVNEAETEYLAIKSRLELIKKEVKKLSIQQMEIDNHIKQIIGEQEKNLDGKRDLILKRIKAVEAKIALIAPELNDERLYHITKGNILKQKLQIVKTSIIEKRKLRNELIILNQQMLKKERLINDLRQQHNDKKIELTGLEVSNKNVLQKLKSLNKKGIQLNKKIDKDLTPFGFSLKDQTADTILNSLDKKRTDFDAAINRRTHEEKDLALIAQELKQLKQQEKEINKRAVSTTKKLETIKLELKKLQLKRTELFGDKEVEVVRNQIKNDLIKKEENSESIKEQLKEAEIQLKSAIAGEIKNKKDLEKVEKQLALQQKQLLAKIKPKGFDNIEVLKIANLSPKEVDKLEILKTTLQKELTQCQQSLKNVTTDLATTLAKKWSTETLETLQVKHQEIAKQIEQLQQQIGRISQQIEDNNRRQKEGKELVDKMDIQQKEFRRWAKLKDIIGSADGKVFRAFAQGLTLKKLSELANRHLLQLNGRYLIHKPSDEDLALQIIDTHHANNIRSIHTLSGGESFLVSLALALGLSDLAGRNTQIKSLFIDEGFGTLDESALDLVISTLENLQEKGKTIGVISHVGALKERITTQIQVLKRGSGFSEVFIEG